MHIAERIMTPKGYFSGEFVEMRLFDRFETSVLPAILFNLMEICVDLPGNTAFWVLKELLGGYISRINPILESFSRDLVRNSLEFAEILQELGEFVVKTQELNVHNPLSFRKMCKMTGFGVNFSYYGLVGEAKNGVEVNIGVRTGKMYLLYRSYTRNSFVDVDCGHFQVKYECFRRVREGLGGQAVEGERIMQAGVQCGVCGQDVSREVYRSCVKGLVQPPAGPCPCSVCLFPSTAEDVCGDHHCCRTCQCKNYFTSHYQFTPCCQSSLELQQIWDIREDIRINRPDLVEIMTNLRHDKALSHMKLPSLRKKIVPKRDRIEEKQSKNAEKTVDLTGNPPRNRCITCQTQYTPSEQGLQCPNSCQCRFCIIQTLVSSTYSVCSICKSDYPESIKLLVRKDYRACHACGLAVATSELETSAPCQICSDCVTIVPIFSLFGLFLSNKGTCSCSECNSEEKFDIDEARYRESRRNVRIKGCCGRLPEIEEKLECGHMVCGTHREVLRRCRVCHRQVVRESRTKARS